MRDDGNLWTLVILIATAAAGVGLFLVVAFLELMRGGPPHMGP